MASQESEAKDGEAESAREERLRTFADAGYDPIIAVGFVYSGAVAKVATEYPDSHFAIIDDEAAKGDNVANLVFAEKQGSFLVGAAAALKTKTEPHRLRRRCRGPAHPEVRGGLLGRGKAGQPGHQDRLGLPHPAAGLLGLR